MSNRRLSMADCERLDAEDAVWNTIARIIDKPLSLNETPRQLRWRLAMVDAATDQDVDDARKCLEEYRMVGGEL